MQWLANNGMAAVAARSENAAGRPLRVMSGVIAAGIVAGLFLVTYKPGAIARFHCSRICGQSNRMTQRQICEQEAPKEMSLRSQDTADGAYSRGKHRSNEQAQKVLKRSSDDKSDPMQNSDTSAGSWRFDSESEASSCPRQGPSL